MVRLAFILCFLLMCRVALGCSFARSWTEFDPSLAKAGDMPPAVPVVTVESVVRDIDKNPISSCHGVGIFVLAIPDTPETEHLVYTFELISDDAVLSHPIPETGVKENGKLKFVRPWYDQSPDRQKPLNLVLKVTAHQRSGLKGGTAEIMITVPAMR